MPNLSTGRLGISEELRAFVDEVPFERRPILEFMERAARELPAGARVLDVGAGDAPYRELFAHLDYRTGDWENSLHEDLPAVDIQAPADDLPVQDGTLDAVLLTQVLEHLADPAKALGELFRVLRPGGRIYLTAPHVWELHELPYDFYRYTEAGLRHLLERAGFEEVDVTARNDCFSTLAQLMRNMTHVMGRAPDGLDERREAAARALRDLAGEVAELAPLDVARTFPLGYAAVGTRPASA